MSSKPIFAAIDPETKLLPPPTMAALKTYLAGNDGLPGKNGTNDTVMADTLNTAGTRFRTAVNDTIKAQVPGEVSTSLANNTTVQQSISTAVSNENIPGKVTAAVSAITANSDTAVAGIVDTATSATRAALFRSATGESAVTYGWLGTPHASASVRKLDAATAQTNLATNPSFESVAAGTTVVRTNLVQNPSFTANLTGWKIGDPGSVLSRDTTVYHTSDASIKSVCDGTVPYQGISTSASGVSIVVGSTYVISAWVFQSVAGAVRIGFGSSTIQFNNSVQVPALQWTRISQVGLGTTATDNAFVYLDTGTVARPVTIWADDILIEQTDQLRPYFDGSTPDALGFDYGWTGTANASTSTAKAAVVEVRRNLSTNPRALNGPGWSSNDGTVNEAVTVTTGVPAHPLGITSAKRSNVRVGKTSTHALSLYNIDTLANPSPARTMGVWILSVQPGYRIEPVGGFPATTLNAGEWVFVTATVAVDTWAGITVSKITGNAVDTDFVYATGCVVEVGTVVKKFYDGDTPSAGDFINSWTGAANASASVQSGITVAGGSGQSASIVSSVIENVRSARVIPLGPVTDNAYEVMSAEVVRTVLKTNTVYTVNATARLTAVQTGILTEDARAIFIHLNGVSLARPSNGEHKAPNTIGSHPVRYTFTTPSSLSNYNVIRLYGGAGTGNGDVYWDNFSIVEGDYTGKYFDGSTAPKKITEALDTRYASVGALNVVAAKVLNGTGSPLNVVTAAVGTLYVDTVSTMGASVWRKASGTGNTGWVVIDGDTGWRVIPITSGWTGNVQIKRINAQIFCKYSNLNPAAITAGSFMNLPVGFYDEADLTIIAPGNEVYATFTLAANGTAYRSAAVATSTLLQQTSWPAPLVWPTSLPGTAG